MIRPGFFTRPISGVLLAALIAVVVFPLARPLLHRRRPASPEPAADQHREQV